MPISVWQFAEFEFHPLRNELQRAGKPVPAEGKPKEVLLYLLRHAGRIVPSDEIKREVWQARNLSEPSVAVALGKLRDAFGGEDRQRIIRTVKGGGYTMAVPVQLIQLADDRPGPQDLHAGRQAPGRPGWLLEAPMEQGEDRASWQICTPEGEARRVLHLGWSESALAQLRWRAEALERVSSSGNNRERFPKLLSTQWENEPYLLKTDWTGPSLPQWAAEQGGLRAVSESERIGIAAELAAALEAAHELGLTHGALTSTEVHIVKSGSGWAVRLDGFGRHPAPCSTEAAECEPDGENVSLKPHSIYRAPELSGAGPGTFAGDLYAYGVLLYQIMAADLIAGPLPGWEQRIHDPVLRQDIAEFAALDPSRRLASADSLAGRLRGLAERRRANEQMEAGLRRAELAERLLAAEQAKRPLRRALVLLAVLVVSAAVFAAFHAISSLRRSRNAALVQIRHARAVRVFLEGLFWDGGAAAQGPISSEGLADRGLEKARLLASEPEEHAELLTTLGASYGALGNYPKAEQVLAEALEERRRSSGPQSPEFAATLMKQAALESDEHQPRAALARAQQALSIERQTLPSDDMTIYRSETTLAEIWTELGEYERAVSLLDGAVNRERGDPALRADLAAALNDESIAENNLGHLERSLDLQEQSMAIDRELLGGRHPDIGEHLMSMDNAHMLLGRYDQAGVEAREALSILREALPPGHHDIAAAEAHLGTALSHQPSQLAEARASLESSLRTLKREPERSATEAYALAALGSVAFQQGCHAEALARYRESLGIYKQVYARPHFSWSIPLTGTAEILYAEHKWRDARQYAGEAYRISEATLHGDDPRRLKASLIFARCLAKIHQQVQAAAIAREVLAEAPAGDFQGEASRKDAQNLLAEIAPIRP